jgi:hypothetical protein
MINFNGSQLYVRFNENPTTPVKLQTQMNNISSIKPLLKQTKRTLQTTTDDKFKEQIIDYELNAINSEISQQWFDTKFRINKQLKIFSLNWKGSTSIGDQKKRIEIKKSDVTTDWDAISSSSSVVNSNSPASSEIKPQDMDGDWDYYVHEVESGYQKKTNLNNTIILINNNISFHKGWRDIESQMDLKGSIYSLKYIPNTSPKVCDPKRSE